MLLGEHAVVYDRPCIVTAVGQRIKVTVEQLSTEDFSLNAPDVGVTDYIKPMARLAKGNVPKGARFVESAVKHFSRIHAITGGVRVTTAAEFSARFGFGSSSASAVCVVKALAQLSGEKLTNKQLFDIAYQAVLDVQGKGSGFDIAAALYGGTLYFVTGGKVIEPLNLKKMPLLVGYTGTKADTVTVVNAVAEKASRHATLVDALFTEIKEIADEARDAMQSNDWPLVGELMDFDQGLLEALGVSSRKLANMIHAARDAGAYGAKLSGAGVGDCMIALTPPGKKRAVSDAIIKAGGEVIDVLPNVEGARIET